MIYPPVQPVRTIPMVTGILAEPNILPTTVGMVEKKPPTKMPLAITKAAVTPSVVEKGHITHMLNPSSMSVINKTLSAPNLSLRMPDTMRPTADAKLNPAVSPAPVLEDRLIDVEKRGMQYGGTKRGKAPSTPARKSSTKVADLKRLLHCSISTLLLWFRWPGLPVDKPGSFIRYPLLYQVSRWQSRSSNKQAVHSKCPSDSEMLDQSFETIANNCPS